MPEVARPPDLTAHGDILAPAPAPNGPPGPGSPNVTAEGYAVWRAKVDAHRCTTIPADAIETCYLGSLTVLVNGNMLVRNGDKLTGSGAPNEISSGASSVVVGDPGVGLADPANQKEFCADLLALRQDWANKTAPQRMAALKTAINKQLGKGGTPSVGVVSVAMTGTTQGKLDFTNWNLKINSTLLNKATLTCPEMTKLGNTVYHEARHAEQWYGIARFASGQRGATAAGVGTSMVIPSRVASAAYRSRVSGTSYAAVFGGTMNTSVYGTQRAYRAGVFRSLRSGQTTANYAQYRALPEESDAWSTGDMMNACTC